MSVEQLQEIAPLHTLTATETTQPFVVLPPGARSYLVRIQYWAALLASGSGTWTFSAQTSTDKAATWTTKTSGAAITLSTTGQNDEQTLQIMTPQINDSGSTWLRVIATLGGSPTGAVMAYRADLVS